MLGRKLGANVHCFARGVDDPKVVGRFALLQACHNAVVVYGHIGLGSQKHKKATSKAFESVYAEARQRRSR